MSELTQSKLTQRQERWLHGLPRGQRLASISGGVMALLGALYVGWAVASFDPTADPRDDVAWDKPIAELGSMYNRFNPILRSMRLATANERILHDGVKRNMAFSAGVMILLVRVLVGTVFCLGGLATLTVVVERRRMLAMIDRLRA